MTDESLLTQAASGDETAFRTLYERHRDVVFRFAYRLLQSNELAEEITHDCFLQLLRYPSRFDARRASLKTYLCSAARNLALKHLRDYGSESPLDEAEESATVVLDAGQMHNLLQAEMVNEVRRAVADLPLLQREALILFEYEEMSLAEVAVIVGADVGAVKARLARARENLRRSLAGYFRGTAIAAARK
ncbi:MAG TPA: RNA polymerase sigma factor [Blastocatellia bacterium]|nr:RNA polymerase sigma factor [Blastocatellia bacterium]